MNKKLVNFFKYNKVAYGVYYAVMNTVLKIIGGVIRKDPNMILFNSFGGRKFDDSPKAIYDAILKDKRFDQMKLVWAFHQPDSFDIERGEKINADSFGYYLTALKAGTWVANSSIEKGLRFKNKNTFYLNTWHGTPIKKLGSDISDSNNSFKAKTDKKKDRDNTDILCAQSQYDKDIFARCFNMPEERIAICGLPRNDCLTCYTEEYAKSIKDKLDIPDDKRVILYCPTFREYIKDDHYGCKMAPPVDMKKWKKALGDQYVLLIRAHYEITSSMNLKEDEFVRDVTAYEDINDLYMIADLLISDYSSVYFDYSITGKAMLHFCYDYDEYDRERGLYFDLRQYLDGAEDEDSLIQKIVNLDKEEAEKKTEAFRSEFVTSYGTATQQMVDCLAEHLSLN